MKNLIASYLLIFSGIITAQNTEVQIKKTKSGCFMDGVKPKTYIHTQSDSCALQDSNALYYEDLNVTDSVIALIVIAKRKVIMDVPRECASEYWFNIEGSTVGIYMYKGSLSITNISSLKYKGMYDFSIYVVSDNAFYNGRVQNGKVLYFFYIRKK